MTVTPLPLPASAPAVTGLNLAGWWPWWEIEQHARGNRPGTITNQRKALTKLVRHFGDVLPAAITADALAQWRDYMRDSEGLKHSTINTYLQTLLTFLRWLVSEGELAEAPKVRLLRQERVSLTPAEVYTSAALVDLACGTHVAARGRSA
ncbi:MAG TPA: phage integrase SAM-like domain-containing protein, partial [Acidimicrobiia bacterium]|nr:phage integrase SAM-like domain-containing protein [Acidimicrobiia bacterium]